MIAKEIFMKDYDFFSCFCPSALLLGPKAPFFALPLSLSFYPGSSFWRTNRHAGLDVDFCHVSLGINLYNLCVFFLSLSLLRGLLLLLLMLVVGARRCFGSSARR